MTDLSSARGGASLGTKGITETNPGQRVSSRELRHSLKLAQRAITKARASRLCYFATTRYVVVSVGLRLIAFVSGVHRCGSVWSCALCAPVVRQRRAGEIEEGVSGWLARGGSALFITATGPHHRGDGLAGLFDLTAKFGRLTMTGRKAKEWRSVLGMVGMIRALEVTWSRRNGWHPHCHSVFLFERALTPSEVADFRSWLFDRWQGVLISKGFGELHPVHGLDVRPVTEVAGLSEYLTAIEGGWGVGLEMARADLKHKGVTPFDLLGDWTFGGDLDARRLWLEYEAVTFGRRCIQWSPGLRVLLLPDVEDLSDEEIAAAEGVDEACVTVEFECREWNVWVRSGEVGLVLRQVEEMAAVLLWMAQGAGKRVKENV